MKLIELDPRWLNEARTLLMFRCPHCADKPVGHGGVFLTAKSVPMSHKAQWEAFYANDLNPHGKGAIIVGTKDEQAWGISGDFDSLTVTPSIDASASGHWHGFITGGEVR